MNKLITWTSPKVKTSALQQTLLKKARQAGRKTLQGMNLIKNLYP